MTIDLTGRVALITGGTRGIGLATAQAMVRAGARVALCSRDAAKAEAVARDLGPGARGYRCDVGIMAEIEALVPAA